jgi:hypothetical protein
MLCAVEGMHWRQCRAGLFSIFIHHRGLEAAAAAAAAAGGGTASANKPAAQLNFSARTLLARDAGIGNVRDGLHSVALANSHGSQCGFGTPWLDQCNR